MTTTSFSTGVGVSSARERRRGRLPGPGGGDPVGERAVAGDGLGTCGHRLAEPILRARHRGPAEGGRGHRDDNDSADDIITTYTVDVSAEAATGTWRLRLQDVVANDSGYLNSWSLQL